MKNLYHKSIFPHIYVYLRHRSRRPKTTRPEGSTARKRRFKIHSPVIFFFLFELFKYSVKQKWVLIKRTRLVGVVGRTKRLQTVNATTNRIWPGKN